VLKVTAGGASLLLTGDIGVDEERALAARAGARLRATVLFAPHHGSGTSSSVAFLRAVAPADAIFQVGYRNRYRHPKPEIWDRYGALGIRRWRTDATGAITLQFGYPPAWAGPALAAYRAQAARYWHEQAKER
jgi:competence protein ComEC